MWGRYLCTGTGSLVAFISALLTPWTAMLGGSGDGGGGGRWS